MSTTQNLKFIHLASDIAATNNTANAGAIIFEPKSGRIAVQGTSKLEYYGGGRVSNAEFDTEHKILTISFNDTAETIKLDFSDTASAEGVNRVLSGLRTDVNALKATVNGAEGVVGLVDKVATNTSAIAAINDGTDGILAQAKSYTNSKVGDIGTDVTVKKYVDDAQAAAKAYTDGKVDGKFDTVGSAAQALEDAKKYTDDEVKKVNTATNALGGRVTTLEGTVGNASSGLVKDVADLSKLHADKDDKTGKKTVAEEVTAGVNAKVGDIKIDGAAVTVKAYVDAAKEAANKYTDGKVSDINATTAGLRSDVNTLKATVGDASNGLVKDVADNTGKLNTLIGSDAGKSARTIANEELAAQLIPEGAKESLDTLQEIAAWIQAHPDDASTMNGKIAALERTVGMPAGDDTEATGLHKDIADNKSAINVNAGAIDALKKLHVDGKTVAQEVTDGIAGIPEASKSAGTDVVVTVKTKSGSVSAVEVNADVLAGKVTANTTAITTEKSRATGVENGLRTDVNAIRSDLGTKTADEGDAFTRIKALEKKQADGTLMWSVWD